VPGVSYTPQSLPAELNSYIAVRVSQIEDPGYFWLQLEDTHEQLEVLMVDLQ